MSLIFKICHRAEWAQAEREGIYAGSAKDREDRFLHFSSADDIRALGEAHPPRAGRRVPFAEGMRLSGGENAARSLD